MPKDALKVNWLEACDMNAIQAHSIVQQELTRAIEKRRGTCMYGCGTQFGGTFLEKVTLQKSATDSEPKSELILVALGT